MKPARTGGKELVNVWVLLQDLNEAREGGGVDRHDVCSTALHVLAVLNAADGGVVFGVAVSGVYADGAKDVFARWFKNGCATKHQVGNDLSIRKVVGVGSDEKELRQLEMLCEDYITNLADCEDRPWGWVVCSVKHVEWVVFGLGDGIAEHCLFEFFGE